MFNMPLWGQAIFWGGVSGSALLVGALVGYYLKLSQRVVAVIMAFGSGVFVYIFGIWAGITLLSSFAAFIGYAVFQNFSHHVLAAVTAVAAGGMLAMIADTMIPEAFEVAHNLAGLVTVAGFLTAFILSKLNLITHPL